MASASSRIRLFFSCQNLKDADTTSKSDPYVTLYSCVSSTGRLTHIGRTETIKNNLNPKFKSSIEIDFHFELRQEFHVGVFDDDGHGESGDDCLGRSKFLLSQVMTARDWTLKLPLDQKGELCIVAQEIGTQRNASVSLIFVGEKFKKMDFFGKADPFFELGRLHPNGSSTLLHRSEVIKNNLNPQWSSTPAFPIEDLTGRDENAETLEFVCYDFDTIGDNDEMGSFKVSLNALKEAQVQKKGFALTKNKKPDKIFGTVYVKELKLDSFPMFGELLRSGWQMNLAVGIDFTASNGPPQRPNSLHYLHPVVPNQYQSAIRSVGEILLEYDTDKLVAVFGFGARVQGAVNHFFHVNQQPNPYVNGVEGIEQAYRSFLPVAVLSGPTNFSPLIRSVTAGARSCEAKRVYTVLLILTDGEVTDMTETIDAVVDADDAPLSIVIVGVGSACDYTAMRVLDGDGCILNGRTRSSRRDLVQFVPFREFLDQPIPLLAQEVLREIPSQMEKYVRLKAMTGRS